MPPDFTIFLVVPVHRILLVACLLYTSPHMVEPGTGASQHPNQMGKERPGKRAVYVGLLRYQRSFDESRLHRGDCFPEKRLPFQNRNDWGKEVGGLDCGGGTA